MLKPYTELEPLPKPWDARTWYGRVRRVAGDMKGLHPVRGNNSCSGLALYLALTKIREQWLPRRTDHEVIVDRGRVFPYLCNNAFAMRTDLYSEVLERDDLQRKGGADEVPLNLLLAERQLPMCFVSQSFGLHPAYNVHPDSKQMEQWAHEEVLRTISREDR